MPDDSSQVSARLSILSASPNGSGGSSYAESQAAGLGTTSSGGIDYRNLDNNRGYLGYDVTHRFVAVVSYDLPFGKGKRLDDGKIVALDVKAGDRILFGKYSGNEIKLDGIEYIIMREEDVLGVLDVAPQALPKTS